MAQQMEISEPEDGKPIIQKTKTPFQLSTRRRAIIISALVLVFVFPLVLVLSISLPNVVAGNKAARNSILSYSRLAPSWLLPGLEDPGIATIPIDRLVNTRELSLSTSFVVSSTPTVREYEFNITQAYGAPDGFRKLMILVNNQSPGPLIEANTGDTVKVLVHNQMANMSTSIHWHGIDQRNSTWMDGVTGVTQCAIPPGEHFTYEFQIIDQRGTFWYHAHTAMQYTDGLFGPIVIHDSTEQTPSADDDRILFIGDHYHKDSTTLRTHYLESSSPWSPFVPGVEPMPDSFLLNGQHTYDCAVNSTTWPASASEEASCTGGALAVINVKPGATTTRLRLINHSTFFSFWFSIDNHTLTTVEIDGVEVEPIPDQRGVYVNVGQRYSVLVTSLPGGEGGSGGSYTMRATLPQSCFVPYCPYVSSGLQSIGYEAVGLFSYPSLNSSNTSSNISSSSSSSLNTTILGSKGNTTNPYGAATNPLRGSAWEGCDDMPFSVPVPKRAKPAFDVVPQNMHEVTFRFQQVGEINRIFLNRTSWSPYNDDATVWKTLNRTFEEGEGGSYSNYGLRLDQQILLVPEAEKGVQVAVNSRDMMEHPFHLHGHSFQIVAWGPGEFEGGSNPKTTWGDLENPMRRDTVTVPAQSHVVLRFLADNPGVWALHCHVGWHMEGGMFVTLLERPDDLRGLIGDMDAGTREATIGFCKAR